MAVECEFRPLTKEEINSFLDEIEDAVDEYRTPPPPNTFANFKHALETAKHLYEEAGQHYMPKDKDKFVPVEEFSARRWLENRCDLKDFENDASAQDIWSQARIWIAQQEWLLRTVLYLYDELRRAKETQ